MKFAVALASILTFSISASAHSLITNVAGANGINGIAMGISDITGASLPLFAQVYRFFRDENFVCGSLLIGGGSFELGTELEKASQNGLPTPAPDGTLTMTVLQMNGDGAGPYTCELSTNGSDGFQPIEVTVNIAGERGRNDVSNAELPLVVRIPGDTTCTGTGGACIVRCKNGLRTPFGNCVAIGSPNSLSRRRPSHRRAQEYPYW